MENQSTNVYVAIKLSQLLGIGSGLCFALLYLSPIASLVLCTLLLISITVLYVTRAKFVLPMLSHMHIDTTHMTLDFPKSKKQFVRSIIAIISLVLLTIISLTLVCRGAYSFAYLKTFASSVVQIGKDSKIVLTSLQVLDIVLYFLPLLSLVGFYFFFPPYSQPSKEPAPCPTPTDKN